MNMDDKTLRDVAANARLDYECVAHFKDDMDIVLNIFAQIEEVDTKDVHPSFHPTITKNYMREDKVEKCDEDMLGSVEHVKDRFILGPKIK